MLEHPSPLRPIPSHGPLPRPPDPNLAATSQAWIHPKATPAYPDSAATSQALESPLAPRRQLFYEPFQPLRDLNHPIRRGNKPRAGERSQFSIQGRKVGAAQAPARTHSVPPPADSPISNAPNCAREQSNSKPKKSKGLSDSPGNSLRKRRFYGQVDPMAHS